MIKQEKQGEVGRFLRFLKTTEPYWIPDFASGFGHDNYGLLVEFMHFSEQ